MYRLKQAIKSPIPGVWIVGAHYEGDVACIRGTLTPPNNSYVDPSDTVSLQALIIHGEEEPPPLATLQRVVRQAREQVVAVYGPVQWLPGPWDVQS
jgi:hypothetical protein